MLFFFFLLQWIVIQVFKVTGLVVFTIGTHSRILWLSVFDAVIYFTKVLTLFNICNKIHNRFSTALKS